jgi:sugar phosphate isomerase/epimerase
MGGRDEDRMKLAFSAWAMREWPVERQIEVVQRAGYVGICLVSGAEFPLDVMRLDSTERRRIRQLLDQANLAPTALASHVNLLEAEEADLDRVRRALDLAAEFADGAAPVPVITMGFGTPEGYEQQRSVLAERFGELARHAEKTGGIVALEPHVGQAMDQPEKIVWLMQTVNSPHFRLNLDNSHFEVMGRDLDDYLPMLVPFAVHTDLKDQRGRSPHHEFLVPGEGDFDYARYLRAMHALGYDGYVTVEISIMVQRREGYDPAEVAARSFTTVTRAADAAGVPLECRTSSST